MRGLKTNKSVIRQKIFEEIAALAYTGGGAAEMEEIPFKIIPGEVATYRDSVFAERAVVGQRLRAAMGMSLFSGGESRRISEGLEDSMISDKYYEPPLIDIIKYACHSCPEKRVLITNGCQGCFEHPCIDVCPKKAIKMVNGKSVIDEILCIKCGKCAEVCPYNAIIVQERPCQKACGIKAISSDEFGRANIDHSKCVSCGQCLVSCPFGAIVDKSQIYQTVKATMSDTPVYAIVAPAIAGQFPQMGFKKMRSSFKALGFTDVVEVAVGADLCTIQEAQDFIDEVPAKIPYMATSCCPAWAKMIRNEFPDQSEKISMSLTPMVLTARLIKKEHPEAKICFIGPCAAKKLEASRKDVKSYVDFVLTFEELGGMFKAKNVNFEEMAEEELPYHTSADGRGFAQSGGVAQAVVNLLGQTHPELEVKVNAAQGLADCKKMMMLAKVGKYNGYLLEGMACPGGCIAGAGTILPINSAKKTLAQSMTESKFNSPLDASYSNELEEIEELFSDRDSFNKD
ncbi:MAG: 4Fe-4S dicluster domain-containing protein [Erysipelotrichaceae bacterium]|nr:4Fe-4S dicluster domain-containing protein [Erysipelotrichaceae bacterium]